MAMTQVQLDRLDELHQQSSWTEAEKSELTGLYKEYDIHISEVGDISFEDMVKVEKDSLNVRQLLWKEIMGIG